MKKFILVQTGKEVKLGNTLIAKKKSNTPFGKIDYTQEILVNEATLPLLIELGIVKEVQEDKLTQLATSANIPMDIQFYIDSIAKRIGATHNTTVDLLNGIHSILPSAVFSIILKEIAIELDKKYSDHIENSPEIYVVSLLDGRITKANKAHIKNYRNFAAFRTIEDAKTACKITRGILKELFKNGK